MKIYEVDNESDNILIIMLIANIAIDALFKIIPIFDNSECIGLTNIK